ncbi:PPC domain-containing protein [Lignipirellula cremea]|uniref:Subtilase-type serine protease n=1 Tax=Lignipirellula cremea TaxID=2528010 RepID=A0A518DWV0_9BACT|nr:PPC domain-containing protein [Lignipirellula cremea]QDU96310.1 hypothetical protein Pla8534_41300 [Lignipirellula cremea]
MSMAPVSRPLSRSARRRSAFHGLLSLTAYVAFSAVAQGQQAPEVGYVDPPCVNPGQTVEVRLGGYDLTPDTQIFLHDARIRCEVLGPPGPMIFPGSPHWMGGRAMNSNKPFGVPRELPVRLTLPADLQPGVVRWQAANVNGISSMGEFLIGSGEPTVNESDCPVVMQSAHDPIGDRQVGYRRLPALPVTICGRLERKEAIDYYSFVPEKSGLVTCSLPAHAYGPAMKPVLEITNHAGRAVADAADTQGRGLHVSFLVQQGAEYRLKLYDLDYRGDWAQVYPLTVLHAPHVLSAVPAAGRRGDTRAVTFWGEGLATGKPGLESTMREITFPSQPESDRFAYQLETPFGKTLPFTFDLTDLDEQIETPRGESPQQLTPPCALTGVLSERQGVDVYRFTAAKGDAWTVLVEANRLGSPLDVDVAVYDAAATRVVSSDDTRTSIDAELLFRAAADGEYTIHISDLAGGDGSPLARYRLVMTPVETGFTLQAPDRLTVIAGEPAVVIEPKRRRVRDEAGVLPLDVVRTAYQGPITIELENLPPGLRTPDVMVIEEKQNRLDIPIWCPADASTAAGWVTIKASAVLEDGTERVVRSSLMMAPVMKPRAVVRPAYPDAGRVVQRGATYLAPVVLERLEGYAGPVELQMAAIPDRVRQGIIGDPIVVPPGVEELPFPLYLPEWVQIDRTSRISLNTIVDQPDGQGKMHRLINRMEKRITMNVEGALLKATVDAAELRLRNGSVAIPVTVSRSVQLSGPVTVDLAGPDNADFQIAPWVRFEGPSNFHAERVTVTEDDTAILQVTAVPGQVESGEHELTIEVRALREGFPVVSQVKVVVLVE